MQSVGPYRLLSALGTCAVGGVWAAVDPAGQPLTVAVLNDAAAKNAGWREAFTAAARALSEAPDDALPVVDADYTGPTPWVACAEEQGPGAGQIFIALGLQYQPGTGPQPVPVEPERAPEPVDAGPEPGSAPPAPPTAILRKPPAPDQPAGGEPVPETVPLPSMAQPHPSIADPPPEDSSPWAPPTVPLGSMAPAEETRNAGAVTASYPLVPADAARTEPPVSPAPHQISAPSVHDGLSLRSGPGVAAVPTGPPAEAPRSGPPMSGPPQAGAYPPGQSLAAPQAGGHPPGSPPASAYQPGPPQPGPPQQPGPPPPGAYSVAPPQAVPRPGQPGLHRPGSRPTAPPPTGPPPTGLPMSAPPLSAPPLSAPPLSAPPYPPYPPYGFAGPPGGPPARARKVGPLLTVIAVVALLVGAGGGAATMYLYSKPQSGTTTTPSPTATVTTTPDLRLPTSAPGQPGVEPPIGGGWPVDAPKFQAEEAAKPMENLAGIGFSFKVPSDWVCTPVESTSGYAKYTCGNGPDLGGDLIVRECPRVCDEDRRTEMRKLEEAWGVQWIRSGRFATWGETTQAAGPGRYGLIYVSYWRSTPEDVIDRQLVLRMTSAPPQADVLRKVVNSIRDTTFTN